MKILIGNTIFVFNVVQNDASSSSSNHDEYQIQFKHRKFLSSLQSPDFEQQRSIRCVRDNQSSVLMKSFVKNLLQEFNVPENTGNDMASHFDFFVTRLSRRSCNRSGSISVAVCLDVKEISPQQAEMIERRRERVERERESRDTVVAVAEMEVAPPMPAKKSVVENLREVVVDEEEEGEGGEGKECAVCLEKFEGGKGIELPCLHVYHKECIRRWLGRNHFCPFCRFKLPC